MSNKTAYFKKHYLGTGDRPLLIRWLPRKHEDLSVRPSGQHLQSCYWKSRYKRIPVSRWPAKSSQISERQVW